MSSKYADLKSDRHNLMGASTFKTDTVKLKSLASTFTVYYKSLKDIVYSETYGKPV